MTAAAVDMAAEGRKLAAFDWLVFGRRTALHCPADLTDVQAEELWDGAEGVTFLCGRRASGVVIPALGERMGLLRCGQCCDRAGYPRGHGAPKNVLEIRQREGWDSCPSSTALLASPASAPRAAPTTTTVAIMAASCGVRTGRRGSRHGRSPGSAGRWTGDRGDQRGSRVVTVASSASPCASLGSLRAASATGRSW